ncbi:MAG: hypothetical protein AAGE52_04305 [Myxococcota bacterium]
MGRLGVVLLLLLGCGDDDGAFDAGADTGVDAVVDVGADSGEDAAPDVPEADTWTNFAEAWLATYCVECHPGSSGTRDYTTPDDVMRDQDRIRCGVSPDRPLEGCATSPAPRQFPVGGGPRPDDESRRRFVAWIEAGLP